MGLVRWTTPTFIFTFDTVDVSDIAEAKLVLKQFESTKLSKNLSTATVDTENKTLSWTLTQAEAGTFTNGTRVSAMCDWVTDSGVRGRSKVWTGMVENAGTDEVITND